MDTSPAFRQELYPPIEPFRSGRLALDGIHTMYWEQSGNPHGVPVVFLHGGPGAGSAPNHRRFFDPDHYNIVIFDQRGAGRSTPLGELRDNTTPLLIADIEKLRVHLGIEEGWRHDQPLQGVRRHRRRDQVVHEDGRLKLPCDVHAAHREQFLIGHAGNVEDRVKADAGQLELGGAVEVRHARPQAHVQHRQPVLSSMVLSVLLAIRA